MQKLHNRDNGVPGGWRYAQPETGAVITGGDYYDLLKKVRAHRRANDLPISVLFEAEVENAVCKSMPPGADLCHHYEEDAPDRPARRVNLDDVGRFFDTMLGIVKTGKAFCSQAEAERRAQICAGCPQNVAIEGCSTCGKMVSVVMSVIGGRSTPLDGKLKGCGVCGCELRTAVHIDLAAQQQAISDEVNEQFVSFCWKKRPMEKAE